MEIKYDIKTEALLLNLDNLIDERNKYLMGIIDEKTKMKTAITKEDFEDSIRNFKEDPIIKALFNRKVNVLRNATNYVITVNAKELRKLDVLS
jgi:hypothetical protein